MWKKTENEYAVLSGYPRDEGDMAKDKLYESPMICTSQILSRRDRYILRNIPGWAPMRSGPVRTPYVGAGLIFAKAHAIQNVPYDPYFRYLFNGEEFDLAMRFFTHGYDVYSPNEPAIFHFYSTIQDNKRLNIKKYSTLGKDEILARSQNRIWQKIGDPGILRLLDIGPNNTELAEVKRYGPGDKRGVRDFLDYFGVDLEQMRVRPACQRVVAGIPHVPWRNPDEDPLRVESRECWNKFGECGEWAAWGECESNRDYMRLKCPVACGACGAPEPSSCSDQYQECEEWAGRGECDKNPAMMRSGCPIACSRALYGPGSKALCVAMN
mmetsp:Transcript_28175/g.62878  ORF Transcript_28175/g.62878 Transcript_28175/m.62878 type:complete len:325 (+) Transcript_28175:302-1276(+)